MSPKYYFNYFTIYCGIGVVTLSGWCSSYFIFDQGLGQALAILWGGPIIVWGLYLIYSGIKKKPENEYQAPEE